LYVDADTHVAENLKLPEHCKQGIGFFALPYIYAPLRRVQAKPTVRRTAVLPDAAR
jgi:hypothetical protein